MAKKNKIFKIAIDSPAAAGAGTIAKKISTHYNLFYLDTGKIYRLIAHLKLKFPKNFNLSFVRSKINSDDFAGTYDVIEEVINEYKSTSFVSK